MVGLLGNMNMNIIGDRERQQDNYLDIYIM